MSRKVLFVASVVKKHINQFHIPYLKWFKERGFEVHVCAKNDFEGGEECRIPYCDKYFDIPFSRSPYSPDNLKAYFMLKRLIDKGGYEVVHCNTPIPAALTRLAAVGARKKGVKVIYTAHGFHFFKGAPPSGCIFYAVEKALSGLTDAIITINGEDYSAAEKICRRNKCKSYLIHGVGVDTVKIHNMQVDPKRIRQSFGIPENAFVVMTTVEINKNKNIASALKAFRNVCNENMYYLICGSGDMKEYCEALSRELEIEKNVIFAGYRYDVFTLLHIADVFLFPSFREGLGIAAIEALAAGVPVIGSDIRGVTEYTVDGVNGILIDPNDVESISRALKLLYEDSGLRHRMGKAAENSVEKFDIRNSVSAMSDIYHEVIGEELLKAEKESVGCENRH